MKFFQVGTVVDSHVDFYHDRVPKKERKKNLVDELMANADFQRYIYLTSITDRFSVTSL
jgi:DNA-directed RNA polymerase subunit N (RpoN/RPB10)